MGNSLTSMKSKYCKCFKLKENDLIEKLIQKRNEVIKKNKKAKVKKVKQNPDNLETSRILMNIENELETLKTNFLKDTNNEDNLILYLNSLYSKNKSEYELYLLLYFNIISCEKKKKFVGNINSLKSSLDRFEALIDGLYNGEKIDEIKKNINYNDLGERNVLFEKNIISNNKDIIYLNKLFIDDKQEYEEELKIILSKRINSKVTLKNKEVYFQSLINYYSNKFLNNKDISLFHFKYMYLIIKRYLNDIKKKDVFSLEENNVFFMIFFSPIIAVKCMLLTHHYSDNINNTPSVLFNYEEIKGTLYVKNKKDNNIVLRITGGNIINKNIFENEMNFSQYIDKIPEIQENIIIKSVKPEFFQNYNFYTRNPIIWNFNKNLLKNIFKSETMKTLFLKIYPEVFNNSSYIFNENETFDELFKSIVFVPYSLEDSYGMTAKDFLIIFINGLPPENIDKISILNSSSSLQILGLHEVGAHWSSAYCSYFFQDNDLFNSVCYSNYPIKDLESEFISYNLKKLDGGNIIEKILFGKIMHETDIKEILFILCKNSYNNNYIEFNKNFRNVSTRELDDVYNEVIQDKDLKEYLNYLKIDLDYLKNISDPILGLKMKRNGDIIKSSLCNKEMRSRHNN